MLQLLLLLRMLPPLLMLRLQKSLKETGQREVPTLPLGHLLQGRARGGG